MLVGSHVIAVGVDEHLGEVEELRDELLHVRRVPLAVPPRQGHGRKEPVRIVKLPALEVEEERRVRLLFNNNQTQKYVTLVNYLNSCCFLQTRCCSHAQKALFPNGSETEKQLGMSVSFRKHFFLKERIGKEKKRNYEPEEPVEGESGRGVVGPVMEGRNGLVLPVGVPLLKVLLPAGVEGAHGLGQVPVVAREAQVQLRRVVVGEDPGEHGILAQIVIGPPW